LSNSSIITKVTIPDKGVSKHKTVVVRRFENHPHGLKETKKQSKLYIFDFMDLEHNIRWQQFFG